jgi:hypothetical protein
VLKQLLTKSPQLLAYQGAGTKYAAVGHSATHWCAGACINVYEVLAYAVYTKYAAVGHSATHWCAGACICVI